MHNPYTMENERFWNQSVGYVIYPESFMDGNGDGIGDIRGIINRLEYLRDLGINLLWICPLFASPGDDHGYDVSDYYQIDPRFGNMDDFRELLREAHNRGIRVLVDFVLNHTSDEHPWFKKALEDPSSQERGYYFFRKGRREGDKLLPPNNWKGFFATSTWTQVEGTDDFYFHIFSKKMPDVDWANPELRKRYYEIARFYLDMGVDGFRLDALAHLGKDRSFEMATTPADEAGLSFDMDRFSNRPEIFDFLSEFKREVLSHYNCFTIGEVGGGLSSQMALRYADRENGYINEVFNFDTVWCNGAFGSIDKPDEEIKTDVLGMKRCLMDWYQTCHEKADMPFYWCNHDHPRVLSQYGSIEYRKESAKALLLLELFMYGTPFVYYGDEIGMSNVRYEKPEDFFSDVGNKNDIASLRARGYSDEQITRVMNRCSRLSARTPMQWEGSELGGFSSVQSKVAPLNPNRFEGVNVAEEQSDPWSIFHFAKYAIWYRRRPEINEMIQKGTFSMLDSNHPDVLAYRHEYNGETLVVIANMRPYETFFGFYWMPKDVILHNYENVIFNNHVFTLRPFECFLMKV